MATHSSILAGEISWLEEASGLQSLGFEKSQTQLSNSATATKTQELQQICLLKPKKKINKEQILKKGKKKNKSVSTLKVLKRELYNLIM